MAYKRAINFNGTPSLDPSYPITPKPIGVGARSLSVVQVDSTTNNLSIGLATHPTASIGVAVLLDKVATNLMTTIGSSSFNPNFGSLIKKLVVSSGTDRLVLMSQITLGLKSVEQTILQAQASVATLTPEQTLQALVLQNIYVNPEDVTSIVMEVIVVNGENSSYILTV
jgi:hypothetical protein